MARFGGKGFLREWLRAIQMKMKKNEPDIPAAGRLVFGGSFNPVHNGHLSILRYVIERRLCNRVLLVLAGQSPFKEPEDYAAAASRLEMVRLAIQELPEAVQSCIDISESEVHRPGPSYTADTLRELEDGIHTGLLIGSDSLESFHNWKEPDWILNRVPLYVVHRVKVEREVVEKAKMRLESYFPLAKIHIIAFEPPDCSSTVIREALARGEGFDRLSKCLPLSVYSYASAHRVYRRETERGPDFA